MYYQQTQDLGESHGQRGRGNTMDLGITGERALILGGTKGLGLSAAKSLAQEGVKIALVGRDPATGSATAQTVPGAVFLEGDLGDKIFRQGIPDVATEALGGAISILITNAGGPPTGEFHETPLSKWRDAFELNLFGHIEIAQLLVPGMTKRGFGRVVNITSFVAKEPYPNMSLSNSVRVALHGAMASLSKEVAGQGVTINNVMPGVMDTGALQRVIKAQMAKSGVDETTVRANLAASVPMGRLGIADDFGPVCAFLCSRLASYITGQSIAVDGGLIHGMS
jgi:3-oxoacyl-[acyl-carrier protein] reductase